MDRWTESPIITLYGDNNKFQTQIHATGKKEAEVEEKEAQSRAIAFDTVVLINYKDANLMVELTFE